MKAADDKNDNPTHDRVPEVVPDVVPDQAKHIQLVVCKDKPRGKVWVSYEENWAGILRPRLECGLWCHGVKLPGRRG